MKLFSFFKKEKRRNPEWYDTGEERWRVVKETDEYELVCLQRKYVDFETGETQWFDIINPVFRTLVEKVVKKS